MATMIPNDVEEFQTEGEKVFFRFLQLVARPDSRYIAWYLPDIKDRELDFLLYCEDVGLVIFEVKDWTLNQIWEANPHSFLLGISGKTEPRRNPLQQAHDYLNSVKEKIQENGQLVSREPAFHGNPKVPIYCGVVFPNINKSEYTGKNLHQIVSGDKNGCQGRC